jgi:dihydrofolate reductase
VFVLTHYPREPLTLGATTFHFVTDGPDAALARARDVAGDLDVGIGGGASTVQQYLRAGSIDSLQIAVSSVLIGRGERLFDDVGDALAGFSPTLIHTSDAAAHYRLERTPRD